MSDHVDQHLEKYLGPIVMGWRQTSEPVDVRVCLFRNQPISGVLTYSTLGLSRHILAMSQEKTVRQELLISAHLRFEHNDLPSLLFYLAEFIIRDHRALFRGEVVPLDYPIVAGSPCTDLYVSVPVVFPEGFDTYQSTQPPTVFAWLFPITAEEKSMIRSMGWSCFEDDLQRRDPDLFDLTRADMGPELK
jgi:hypothetical protein